MEYVLLMVPKIWRKSKLVACIVNTWISFKYLKVNYITLGLDIVGLVPLT